jgi:Protein of unknown function (DUF3047)
MKQQVAALVSIAVITQACTSYQTVRAPTTQAAATEQVAPELICDVTLDDFTTGALGEFPNGWETPDSGDLEAARASGAFRVVDINGRRALHVRHAGGAVFTLGRGAPAWNLDTHPIVTWQWKVNRIPQGGASIDEDMPASVQAVWFVGLPFFVRTLRYTWSAATPAGTRAEARLGHDQVVVLRSGVAAGDGWHTERVDLREQYRTLFEQSDSQAPAGLSIQTGVADDGRPAEAYYAGFKLCRAPS